MTEVIFGRENGMKLQGTIIKFNHKTAKVILSEAVGRYPKGARFNVSYSLITNLDGTKFKTHHDQTPATLAERVGLLHDAIDRQKNDRSPELPDYKSPFFPYEDVCIIRACNAIFASLSPENISCDGEASRDEIRRNMNKFNFKLANLNAALGYIVNEEYCSEVVEYFAKRGND